MVKAATLTTLGPLNTNVLKKYIHTVYLYIYYYKNFFYYYYAYAKYKTLVGKENKLPSGTKNIDKSCIVILFTTIVVPIKLYEWN